MNLTSEEIEDYLDQIASASKIVDVDDKVLLFKYPNLDNKMESRRVHRLEYKKSINEGLLSTDDMRGLIKERHLITDEERHELSSLKSKLDAQKVLLAKTTRVRAKQDRVKDIIHDIEKKIRDIEYKERSKFSMTAETKAEEAKILYLCWSNCYSFPTKNLYWDLYDEFLNETDYLFRQKVTSEFILFYGGIPTKYIRAIARSNLWRIKYVTSIKTSEFLFGRPTSEYSSDMLNLAYWSHYYQNIYEMLSEDQPSEDIIEDNEALDAYMKDYYDERTRDTAARKSKNKHSGKLSAFDQEEVIVTKSNELYDDIEFDTPREAASIKDKPMIRKKARR
jgi:hypothetical protein